MRHYPLLFVILSLLLLSACKDEIDSIGLNLQNRDELINAERVEVPLSAYSLREDSIYTKNLLNNMAGEILDPVFGATSAGFCTQFALAGNTVDFEDAVLDSIVLGLQYLGYFGDTTSPIALEIYQLDEKLDKESYYSNDDAPVIKGSNLCYANSAVHFMPSSAVVLDTVITAAHLRVRLSDELGHQLMSRFTNTAEFQEQFYGLMVKGNRQQSTGCLGYFSLTSAMSGITIYYHTETGSARYTFPISAECVRYNFFTHDYSTAAHDMHAQVFENDTLLGKHTLYLQPTAGVKTVLSLCELRSLFTDKQVIINKAELVLTNISEDESFFFTPYNLGLQSVGADGTLSYLPDDAVYTSTEYFGGTYDASTREYRFRITNYIQHLLKKMSNTTLPDDPKINITVSGAGVRGNRLIFRGTDPMYDDHLRLDLYYTTY